MKRFTLILSLLVAMVTTAMAQVCTTSIDVTKYYTLGCKATDHGTFINDNGTIIEGRSSTGTYFTFEVGETEGTYYIKSHVSGKYINCDDEYKLSASTEKSTAWVLGTVGNTVTFKHPNATRYLNNNGSGSWDSNTINNLQANNHASGPSASNACSIWELREAVPGVVSGKVYRIVNKANAGKVIAENSDNYELVMQNKEDNNRAQLWLAEGNNITGYSFKNLKTADYANYVDATYTHWRTTDSPVKFYVTKVDDATESTPNYYAITFNDKVPLQNYAYMHYSNGYVVRWQAHDNTNIVNPSLWEFEEVSIDDSSAGDELYAEWKEQILSTVEAANGLITASDFSATAVALTTENTTCPAAVADNSDGGGVAALLDDDNDTYMHTKYPNKGSYDGHHYIQVDLGDGKEAKYISFSYRARHNNQNNNPETIIVQGSADGATYTDIQTLTNLPDGLIEYNSKFIGNGNAYRYFRFVVTETTNNAKNSDYVFFSLAKFRMNTYTINDNYVSKSIVLDNLNKWINEKGEISDEKPADWCLINGRIALNELQALVHGATLREYPFTLTTDINAPVCYHILSGRGNATSTYYFTLKPNNNGKVKLETTTKDNVYSYWFFMEEPETGMLLVVPFIDESKPLGYVTVQDGDSKLTNNHSQEGFAGYHYELIEYAGVDGFPYALKPYGASTNVSNHGGVSNFMGFYNGASDGGTAMKFEEVVCPALEFRQLPSAIAAANSACPGADRTGEMLNGYSTESVNAYKTVVAEAAALYETATTTSEIINEYLGKLPNLYEELVINLPEPGNYYRLRCSDGNKRILSTLVDKNTDDKRLKMENSLPKEAIFYYDGNSLLSYTTGLYIDAYRFKEVGSKNTITFSKASNKVLGCYNINIDGRYIYGTGNYIDSGSGNPDQRNGYNWWIEEVTELPVAVSAAGYATLYAPVALTVPTGVTAHTVALNGEWATLSEPLTTIPANTGVVLAGAENTYNFAITTSAAFEGENDLAGTVAATNVTDDAYVLSYIDTNEDEVKDEVGFYTAKKNQAGNTAFLNNSHKAYLVVEGASQSNYIRFGEGTTGIDEITENREQSTVIYDLTGRKIENITAPGIYVVGGKKVLVR